MESVSHWVQEATGVLLICSVTFPDIKQAACDGGSQWRAALVGHTVSTEMHRDRKTTAALSEWGGRFIQVQSFSALLRYLNVYAAQYFTSTTLQRAHYGFCFFKSTSIIWHFMKRIQLQARHKKACWGSFKTPNFTNKPHSHPNYAEPLVPVQLFSTD